MELTNIQIAKFKVKLYKYFVEVKEYDNVEDIKVPFIMSADNRIGIEIKNNILRKELLPFFDTNTRNGINLSFMDEKGSFFNITFIKYCIDLINILQVRSVNTLDYAIYINSGSNKPIIFENQHIKIYLANIHSEEQY